MVLLWRAPSISEGSCCGVRPPSAKGLSWRAPLSHRPTLQRFWVQGDTPCTPGGGCAPCTLLGGGIGTTESTADSRTSSSSGWSKASTCPAQGTWWSGRPAAGSSWASVCPRYYTELRWQERIAQRQMRLHRQGWGCRLAERGAGGVPLFWKTSEGGLGGITAPATISPLSVPVSVLGGRLGSVRAQP